MPSLNYKRLIIFIFLSIGYHVSPGKTGNHYFLNITERDGFNPNIITCMLEDHKGYIWFGTKQGLNRYDGYKIERFTNQYGNDNSLSGNYIYGLAEDKNGLIWISATRDGLNCYDPVKKRFTRYRHKENDSPGLLTENITRVFIDSRNRLWIGYSGLGWCIYDLQTKKFSNFHAATSYTDLYGLNASNTPTWFEEDKNGSIWIATNYGLHCQDTQGHITSYIEKNRNNNPQADNLFTCSYFSDDTTLWLGTWGAGLKKLNTRTQKMSQFTFDKINPVSSIRDIVLHIVPKSKDELWIGTADKGLGIFNVKTGKFIFLPHDPSDPYSPLPGECNGMLYTRNGTLWAGFYNGISKSIPQSEYFTYTAIEEPPIEYKEHITPNAFYKDTTSGILYVGCIAGKGLYMINEKTGRQQVLSLPRIALGKTGFSGVDIGCILPQKQDQLLLTTNYGIYNFETNNKKFTHYDIKDQENKPLQGISELIKAGNGYWCNAGFNNGFYFLDSNLEKAIHYYMGTPSPVSFNSNDVRVLLNENDTTIWITKRDIGLGIFNPQSNTFHQVAGANAAMYGNALHKYGAHYWLSSYEHGVFRISEEKNGKLSFTHFGEGEGLLSDFIYDMCIDDKGNVWVATQKGPAVLPEGKNKFVSYTEHNGFIQHSFIYNTITQVADGNIYMGLRKELIKFSPDSLLFTTTVPDLYLSSLKIFDREWNDTANLDTLKNIDLRYNQNFISASFIALEYTDPNSVQYAYKMDGIDNDWVYAGHRQFLSYSGIPPGSYSLHIKAANGQGIWGRHEILLGIVIHPPFWKTWWFMSLSIAAGMGVVVFGVRNRIQQIKKEAKIKADFNKKMAEVEMKALRAQMNPHFLFNCLNSINRFIVINDTIKASNYLTKFSKLIRLILDNSSGDTTTLENEISLLRLYIEMESMRFDGKFTYSIDIDKTLACDTIIIPSMIIQPYIENAIWHGLLNKGDNGHLLLCFIDKGIDELEVIIEDNGVGRQKAQELKSKSTLKNKSYGMQITNDRIKVLNQLYDAASNVKIEDLYNTDHTPAGTRVILHIPYNKQKNGISKQE